MITKIALTNWRSHAKSEFALTSGTNALLGIMGSGKSSVLQALCFGLFGDLPELNSRKITLNDLIMRKPQPKEHAEVEIGFRIGEKDYTVKRKIEKDKGTVLAELREGGKLLEGPSPEKTTYLVEKILKVDYEMFVQAVYSEQNGIDNFLTIPKGKRMSKIDELLRIDKLEEGRKTLSGISNKISLTIDEQERFLASVDVAKLNSDLQEALAKIAHLKVQEKNIADEIVRIAEELTNVEKSEAELEKRKREMLELEKEKFGFGKQIADVDRRLKELGVHEASPDCEAKLKAAEEKAALFEKIEKRLNASRAEARALEASLSEMKKRKDVLSKELDEVAGTSAAELDRTAKELAKQLQSQNQKIEKMKREKPQKEVLELEKEVSWLGKEVERLKGVTGELARLREDADKIEGVSQMLAEAETSYDEASREISKNEAARMQAEEQLKQLEGAGGVCPLCETPLEADKKHELAAKRKETIGEMEWKSGELLSSLKLADERKKGLARQLDGLKKAAEKFRDVSAMAKELEKHEKRLAMARESLSGAKARLGGAEDELASAEDSVSKIQIEKWRFEGFFKAKKELEDLTDKIEKMGGEFSLIKEDVGVREEEIAEKDTVLKTVQHLKRVVEFAKLSASKHHLASEAHNASAKLEALGFKEDELKQTAHRARELKGLLGERKAEAKSLPSMAGEVRRRHEEIEKNLVRANNYKEEVEALRILSDRIAIIHNSFREAQVALRRDFVHSINGSLADLWPLLYPYRDFTSLRLTIEDIKGRTGGDYILQVKEGERWIDVDGFASGGERSLACLALRVGFAKVLVPQLRWLILDEPTHNMDARGIRELADALRERIPQIIDQVILITHEDALEQAVSGFAYRLERNKAINEPTQVKSLLEG